MSEARTLREREAALRAEIEQAEEKRRRIAEAIESRRKTLSRLQAKLVLNDENGAAPRDHG